MRVFIIKKKTLLKVTLCVAAVIGVAVYSQISGIGTKDVFNNTYAEKMPVCSAETNAKEVALTIDTAFGDDYTAQMLDTLAKNQVKATFFVMGAWGSENPDLVSRMLSEGHEILSHSMNHIRYPDVTETETVADATAAKEYIAAATGKDSNFIRLPYGAFDEKTLTALENAGFVPMKWSVDGEDWKTDDKKVVYNNVLKNIKGGDIIMLQNNTKSGNAALEQIITALKEKGYELSTVSDMLPDGPLMTDEKGKATLFDE